MLVKTEIKAAIITGILGIIGTVSAAIIGINAGKSTEQKNIQNEINEVMGDMVNIIGDDNEVTFNDIKDLVDDYQDLITQNDSLTAQNTKYFDDLTNANNQIDDLQAKINDIPTINYSNLGLSINGEDIQINQNKSMISIDGRDYVSKEVMEKLISNNQDITIRDDTIFVGKVIAGKEKLSDQYIMDSLRCQIEDNATDSYGDLHNDCIVLSSGLYGSSEIQFNVNNNFNMLMGTLFVHEGASKGDSTVVTIKADDEVIYTTNLESDTVPILIDLPINNCSTITITKNGDDYFACVLSNAILYN